MRPIGEPLTVDNEPELMEYLQDILQRSKVSPLEPIRTAPKNRPILVYCPSHNLEAYADFFAVARWVDCDYDGREGWFDNFDMLNPTHWMELPEKPHGNS
jgi:hypothetical protein